MDSTKTTLLRTDLNDGGIIALTRLVKHARQPLEVILEYGEQSLTALLARDATVLTLLSYASKPGYLDMTGTMFW